ncbi:MAG: hypothetical protein PWP41_1860 [Moorella sp. (in: firmicutes)]|nr:hypothetical protein [Moorella sp. (in: firmicutes)]
MSRLDDYLQDVCRHIRRKEMHREVAAELLGHLEDLVAQLQEEGINRGRKRKPATGWGSPACWGGNWIAFTAPG